MHYPNTLMEKAISSTNNVVPSPTLAQQTGNNDVVVTPSLGTRVPYANAQCVLFLVLTKREVMVGRHASTVSLILSGLSSSNNVSCCLDNTEIYCHL